jgi:DNA-binding MarR family transcriptional regulator
MNDVRQEQTCDPVRLVEALMHSGRLTEARLDVALSAVGLSTAKWGALRRLAEADAPLLLSQLAGKLACVKSNATQLVDRLEAERLVRRVPDPDDRRAIQAELTAEGRRRYAAGLAVMQAFEREVLGDYTAAEREVLRKLLARLESYDHGAA